MEVDLGEHPAALGTTCGGKTGAIPGVRVERKGTSSLLGTSRCSWLGQEPSSALRETGPSSTERTLSANFKEHSVSLVFFSAGETCGQGGAGTKSPWRLPVHPEGSPLGNLLLLAGEKLLLTCPSQASPVHPRLGQCLSHLDSLSPTAPVRGAAWNSCGRCRGSGSPHGDLVWVPAAGSGGSQGTGEEAARA